MNNKLEKELYFKLININKEYVTNDIKSVLLLNKILPEDILWLISNELFDEIKKEPTYEFDSYNNYIAEQFEEWSTYKWESNSIRDKYNLPTLIQITYSYPFDDFHNYHHKNLEKKTGHNIKSILGIEIEIGYGYDKYITLEYEHDKSDILDVDIILNKSIKIFGNMNKNEINK